eukprot:scaffold27414_cov92-Phaeocystis_antarctica.AAC.2
MVGFISNLARLLNYLRRRSPGPPFPPDHRQAGERGAKNEIILYEMKNLFIWPCDEIIAGISRPGYHSGWEHIFVTRIPRYLPVKTAEAHFVVVFLRL